MNSNALVVPVILSGGMGTRLWPLSRGGYPKQFLNLHQPERSLIQETVLRVADSDRFSPPIFLSNASHRFLVAEKMQEAGMDWKEIILEPCSRNTGPALAVAAFSIAEKQPDAFMLVLPSDHIIKDNGAFLDAVGRAFAVAKEGYLTTFGITPTRADTGYGYIQYGDDLEVGGHRVARFVEKPDEKTAQRYLDEGNYGWNSGMFLFPISVFIEELKAHQPEIARLAKRAAESRHRDEDFSRLSEELFSSMPSISVDYAIMEHTNRAAVVPMECGWTDAGSWNALWEVHEKDANENVCIGDSYRLDTEGCYIACDGGTTVATLGVRNLVVISTKDCILVADRSRAQEVKGLVEQVKSTEPELVEQYRQIYRPWGHYDLIDAGDRHQVKRITVKPGASLSLQMHYHRAEHWVVVSGTALVTRDEERQVITENQSIYIPYGAKHRLENPGKIPLEIIEVQSGAYLGEDDIVRFEDSYGRVQLA